MPAPLPQELNERIVIKNVVVPYNATTQEGTNSSTYITAWARITESGGIIEETDLESQAQTQNFEIWTQYDSGITGFMQVEWGDRVLTQVEPPQKFTDVNNRRWTVMQCQEVTERDVS